MTATTPTGTDQDADNERRIEELGRLMLAAYARYEQSGCFGDRGEADRYLRLQAEAICRRSPGHVSRLETARGLRGG